MERWTLESSIRPNLEVWSSITTSKQQANKLYFKNLYLMEKLVSTSKQNEGNVRN